MTTLYTIGHSRHPAERFVELLAAQEIAVLVDVRSHPVSRWAPHFGQAALTSLLAAHGVEYVFLGRELGGRPEASEFYRPDGTLDYERRAQAPDFREGVERLLALARERRTIMLCAEEDPANCHRRLLITPAVLREGVGVVNVRGEGRVEVEAREPDVPSPG
jgi:uncharacterized protein (DUF488 family)